MSARLRHGLSKRERQIMEAIYSRKKASVADVRADIPAPPGYSGVRATLNVLVAKGLLSYRRAGRRYVYASTISHQKARQSAIRHLLSTYFDNSIEAALVALLRADRRRLAEADYRKLVELINNAEKEGLR